MEIKHFTLINSHTQEILDFDSQHTVKDVVFSMQENWKPSDANSEFKYYGLTEKGESYTYWTDHFQKIWVHINYYGKVD